MIRYTHAETESDKKAETCKGRDRETERQRYGDSLCLSVRLCLYVFVHYPSTQQVYKDAMKRTGRDKFFYDKYKPIKTTACEDGVCLSHSLSLSLSLCLSLYLPP